MKKAFILLSAICLAFISCSKDDNDLGQFDYDTEILFGTWQATNIVTGTGAEWPWSYGTTTATFNSNGKYSGKGYFGTGSGTYKLSGKNITCYVDGSEYCRYTVISFGSGNTTCILDMTMGGSTLRIKCKKL